MRFKSYNFYGLEYLNFTINKGNTIFHSEEDYQMFDFLSGKNSKKIHLHLTNVSAVIAYNFVSLIPLQTFNEIETQVKIQFAPNRKEIFEIEMNEMSQIPQLNIIWQDSKQKFLQKELLLDEISTSLSTLDLGLIEEDY